MHVVHEATANALWQMPAADLDTRWSATAQILNAAAIEQFYPRWYDTTQMLDTTRILNIAQDALEALFKAGTTERNRDTMRPLMQKLMITLPTYVINTINAESKTSRELAGQREMLRLQNKHARKKTRNSSLE